MFGRGEVVLPVRGSVFYGSLLIGRILGGRRFPLRCGLGRSFGGVGRLCGIRSRGLAVPPGLGRPPRGLVAELSICRGNVLALVRFASNDDRGDLFASIALEAFFRGLLLGDRDPDGGFTGGFVSTVGGRGFGRSLFVRGGLR